MTWPRPYCFSPHPRLPVSLAPGRRHSFSIRNSAGKPTGPSPGRGIPRSSPFPGTRPDPFRRRNAPLFTGSSHKGLRTGHWGTWIGPLCWCTPPTVFTRKLHSLTEDPQPRPDDGGGREPRLDSAFLSRPPWTIQILGVRPACPTTLGR